MRELKFRAWDKKKKVMFPVNGLQFNFSGVKMVRTYAIADNLKSSQNVEVLQYTGLKDKNGKEIYEWDVLLIEGKTIRTVESTMSWDWGGATVYGWIIGTDNPEQASEVIGNIYENPELLKNKETV